MQQCIYDFCVVRASKGTEWKALVDGSDNQLGYRAF
jgi:hypothetical protein